MPAGFCNDTADRIVFCVYNHPFTDCELIVILSDVDNADAVHIIAQSRYAERSAYVFNLNHNGKSAIRIDFKLARGIACYLFAAFVNKHCGRLDLRAELGTLNAVLLFVGGFDFGVSFTLLGIVFLLRLRNLCILLRCRQSFIRLYACDCTVKQFLFSFAFLCENTYALVNRAYVGQIFIVYVKLRAIFVVQLFVLLVDTLDVARYAPLYRISVGVLGENLNLDKIIHIVKRHLGIEYQSNAVRFLILVVFINYGNIVDGYPGCYLQEVGHRRYYYKYKYGYQDEDTNHNFFHILSSSYGIILWYFLLSFTNRADRLAPNSMSEIKERIR